MNKQITNKQQLLRNAQLKIAKEVKRICEKNNINYFLDCGSMLGAIRHKGFIPWDDDIDIGMLKEDYEKFLKIDPHEMGEEFFIDNYENNSDYGLVFSKVKLKNTRYVEKIADKNAEHLEIFVDIFPYFERPKNKIVRRMQTIKLKILAQLFMAKSGMKVWKNKKKIGNIKFLPIVVLSKIISKKNIYRSINKSFNKKQNSNIIGIHSGSCYDTWFYSKEYLTKFIDITFENEIFKIPKEYDKILTVCYGNYMELPPINKRVTHNIIELDLGKYK